MPNAATPAKIAKIAIPMIQLRFDRRGPISVPSVGVSGGKTLMSVCDCVAIIIPILVQKPLMSSSGICALLPQTVDDAENRRHKEECRDDGEE